MLCHIQQRLLDVPQLLRRGNAESPEKIPWWQSLDASHKRDGGAAPDGINDSTTFPNEREDRTRRSSPSLIRLWRGAKAAFYRPLPGSINRG